MEHKQPSAEVSKHKKKQHKPRSLLLLLKSFVGLRVRIDLKNDSMLEGVVQEVVQDMDFTLLDVCETKPNGATQQLDEVFVMGKTVLYVHIPDRINITQHLQQYVRTIADNATLMVFSDAFFGLLLASDSHDSPERDNCELEPSTKSLLKVSEPILELLNMIFLELGLA
ncbi:hypothetical protein BBO99_00003139 [Phytophthora kernoviae]|uniref:Sm domain-containing protein n=2 Tax=Phytophthora kernoviae TaxID=325452 RepID=A0A3R7KLJ2_9STRA|nr:hypothetical protein G195_003436 [Phytophthora kernoviae 00238/432]KAG2528482.1 hypothetical protein JM16_002801 [Phytophthora kernoviae]KAG2530052.1 hypothetical protein JM18_002593 [Phytophthora kernoviae]RLM95356.1 hypothetical protein BBI17_003148 [Phytophthora kernoviae]RLN82108.1 hypothetical protein BBO99_00003139 [Phytophthora kernoviae]